MDEDDPLVTKGTLVIIGKLILMITMSILAVTLTYRTLGDIASLVVAFLTAFVLYLCLED